MFQLKNWYIEKLQNGRIVGFGNCYENPKFPPGYYVHTSVVLEIRTDENGRGFMLLTRSGSCYETEFAEINPVLIERTVEALRSLDIHLDKEECLALRRQREEEIWHESW